MLTITSLEVNRFWQDVLAQHQEKVYKSYYKQENTHTFVSPKINNSFACELPDEMTGKHWGQNKMANILQVTHSKHIFLKGKFCLLLKISLSLFLRIWQNKSALIQLGTELVGDKPLAETYNDSINWGMCALFAGSGRKSCNPFHQFLGNLDQRNFIVMISTIHLFIYPVIKNTCIERPHYDEWYSFRSMNIIQMAIHTL